MSKNIKACLSSNTDDWATPKFFLNSLIDCGYKDLFPFKSDYNEFDNNYYHEKLFINPPFSKLDHVVNWLCDGIIQNNFVALLIPSRTDTKYFHRLLDLKPYIYFIKGRVHYNDLKSAPFPSVCLIFGNLKIFNLYGYGSFENLLNYLKDIKYY